MISTANGYQESRQAAVAAEGRSRQRAAPAHVTALHDTVVVDSETTITTRIVSHASQTGGTRGGLPPRKISFSGEFRERRRAG